MKSMRKGFTLIELMIVIAIIAIIAAIAIPNLMQSRIRANEAVAVSTIKEYATAQVTFQVGKQGRNNLATKTGNNGFADNFQNMYYSVAVGQATAKQPMALISKAMADARGAAAKAGAAPVDTATTGLTVSAGPYQGYFLNEPADQADYLYNFAILATPADSTTTGTNAYWIDQQGTVYMLGLAGGETQKPGDSKTTLGAMTETPSTKKDNWIVG